MPTTRTLSPIPATLTEDYASTASGQTLTVVTGTSGKQTRIWGFEYTIGGSSQTVQWKSGSTNLHAPHRLLSRSWPPPQSSSGTERAMPFLVGGSGEDITLNLGTTATTIEVTVWYDQV